MPHRNRLEACPTSAWFGSCRVPTLPDRPARLKLELWARSAIFPPCRFTSSIAKSAGKTAKSWCGRAAGRARPVPTAVPPSCRRSCRSSRRAWALPTRCRPAPCKGAADAEAALPGGRIRINESSSTFRPCLVRWIGYGGSVNVYPDPGSGSAGFRNRGCPSPARVVRTTVQREGRTYPLRPPA